MPCTHAGHAAAHRRAVLAATRARARRPRRRRAAASVSRNPANVPIAFDPPPTHATTTSGSAPPRISRHCAARLVADDALELAHHPRERMRADDRADAVVRRLDGRDPVAQRLVDRVLERRAARLDRDDLGAEQLHAPHVERLALDVDRAHEDGAVEPEQRGGGRGRDAVLAGARSRRSPAACPCGA